MGIQTKVMGPIALLAVIALIASVFGMVNLYNVQSKSNLITENYMQGIMDLDSMTNEFVKYQQLMLEHCLAEDEDKLILEDEMAVSRENVVALHENYEKGIVSEEEVALMEDYSKLFDEYLDMCDMTVSMSKSGNNEGAIRYVNGKLTVTSEEITAILEELNTVNKTLIDEAVADQGKVFSIAVIISVVMLASLVVIVVIAIIICRKVILKPITRTEQQLGEIIEGIRQGRGDLTKRVQVTSNDELGRLGQEINLFIETLQYILDGITGSTDRMTQVVECVVSSVTNAGDSTQDVSAVMEELSAGFQEISANVQSLYSEIDNIGQQVVGFADASQDLDNYADEMKERANSLERNAIDNENATRIMIERMSAGMQAAVEESKAVEQVDELAKEILEVADQTNLLSLNASIEAARAGEAGRGFAVVADEIRKLADSTTETAEKIQTINKAVVTAVDKLVEQSTMTNDYLMNTIMQDYHNFVAVGQQYQGDSQHISQMMEDFRNKTGILSKKMDEIIRTAANITNIIDDSASGVVTVAENAGQLVREMNNVKDRMTENQIIVGDFTKETDRFITR